MALLSERIPASEDGEGENEATTLLPVLAQLSRLLNECRFPAFWQLYRDESLSYLRENFTVEVLGFEDAIREVVFKAVKCTFTKIGVARLASYLDLSSKYVLEIEYKFSEAIQAIPLRNILPLWGGPWTRTRGLSLSHQIRTIPSKQQ